MFRLARNHQTANLWLKTRLQGTLFRLARNHQTANLWRYIRRLCALFRLARNHQTANLTCWSTSMRSSVPVGPQSPDR